ncbi:MAG: amidohydrolase family protein [bacterium]|nr:amidohydrolase family protein [bacterium]
MIDAYCHVGLPRFGSAEEALSVAELYGIEKSVLVLGPMVPDFETLIRAMRKYGDRIRAVGIPFGQTPGQQIESTDLLLRAGAMAMRLQSDELHPEILDRIGQMGRMIYAVGLRGGGAAAQTHLDWLERFPNGKVAAPHFLSPDASRIEGALASLIQHPRFFPIFSRHGGLGSQAAYPHDDLKPWVDAVIALSGFDRIMWGSEYPVVYWRNETMPDCQNWLGKLLKGKNLAGFFKENAQREIFDTPSPKCESVTIPAWVSESFDQTRTVPTFDPGGLALPMAVYDKLHPLYVTRLKSNRSLRFSDFVIDLIAEKVL